MWHGLIILLGLIFAAFVCGPQVFDYIKGLGGQVNTATAPIIQKVGLKRDLSTPSKRLVGHWTSGNQHEYFGHVDKTTQIGSYTVVYPDSTAVRLQYKVERELLQGQMLELGVIMDGMAVPASFTIGSDGLRLRVNSVGNKVINQMRNYVDGNTQP